MRQKLNFTHGRKVLDFISTYIKKEKVWIRKEKA